MKKLLYTTAVLAGLASAQISAWVHKIINDTDYKVWVEVHYHGASQILKSCRPDKLFIDAKQEATVDAKSCSIRTIVGNVQQATDKKISFKAYSPPVGYVGNGTFWITESSPGAYSIDRTDTISLRHSLTNGSDKTIDVFMWLHGESMLGTNAENCLKNPLTSCCRRERRGLKPGERVEWTTGGCQIKSIRVEDVGIDYRVTVNIRNASVNELKKVGVVVAGVLVVAGAVAATVVTGGAVGAALGGAAGAGATGAGAAGAIAAGAGAVKGAVAGAALGASLGAGAGTTAGLVGAGVTGGAVSGALGASTILVSGAGVVGTGAAIGGGVGATVGGTAGAAGAGVGFSSVAKKAFANVENELVAYGSTGWLYDGTMIGPVNGVIVYKK